MRSDSLRTPREAGAAISDQDPVSTASAASAPAAPHGPAPGHTPAAREPVIGTALLNPTDAGFLLAESDTTPMHIAGLMIFRLPPGAGPDFVHRLVADLRAHVQAARPFNRKLVPGLLGRLLPRWEVVSQVDLEFHLQHHALPWPGTQRELGILVSRLHSTRLDRHRPLWECHLIEGLEGDRLAVYLKVHHALVDGIGAIRIVRKALSTDPAERGMPPIWAYRTTRRRRGTDAPAQAGRPAASQLLRPLRGVWSQRAGAQALMRMYAGLDPARLRRTEPDLVRPYTAPRSALNGPITGHRRIATQSFGMERLRALAAASGGTLNDVVLAICAGGLRRYLTELGALPPEALVASVPMSFRPADREETDGNAVTMALATLATDIPDARQRFAAIAASTAAAKEHMGRLPQPAVLPYSMALTAPMAAAILANVGDRTRPMFNVVISNVPGPEQPLHLNGARLEQWYPVSLMFTGQALNITALSYADQMSLTFTACGTTLPHVQHLALHCAEALTELEDAFAGTARPAHE